MRNQEGRQTAQVAVALHLSFIIYHLSLSPNDRDRSNNATARRRPGFENGTRGLRRGAAVLPLRRGRRLAPARLVCWPCSDSLKLHAPGLLASGPMLTYGRVHAAADTALLYGFGVPPALGVGLWLLCRQGRTRLAGPAVVFVGALGWNAAVAAGLWAILRGGGSGYEVFEMPGAVAPLLLVSYLLIGICGMMTFRRREPGPLYPSQWFVFGALFWFAWIFSTAALLLLRFAAARRAPGRGELVV